jgi:hypothetical protein
MRSPISRALLAQVAEAFVRLDGTLKGRPAPRLRGLG